ncbi:hypothetical protein BDF14DRAFT_1727906 [Spinellus fusiger]|nr:hypothetical protein BDF14DRAFT_1727906 [Spinellus fusiger]
MPTPNSAVNNTISPTDSNACKYSTLPLEEQPCPKYREFLSASRPERTMMIERLVETAADIIDSIWQPRFLTNDKVKVVPTKGFIREILCRSKATYSTLQICLFYLFRVKKIVHEKLRKRHQSSSPSSSPSPPSSSTSLSASSLSNHVNTFHECSLKTNNRTEELMCCGRRMFLAALMLASKYLHDKNYRNQSWAKISGLSMREINAAEMAFLQLIDYKLYVSKPTFDKWYTLLHGYTCSKK